VVRLSIAAPTATEFPSWFVEDIGVLRNWNRLLACCQMVFYQESRAVEEKAHECNQES
jgi:hypothetical protein